MKVVIADNSYYSIDSPEEMLCMYAHAEIVAACKNRTNTPEALLTLKPNRSIFKLKMPGRSGLEVLSEILKENKTLKSIILTFLSTNNSRQKAMEAGANYFFSKVDDFEKVSQVVSQLMQKENNTNINIAS